jgi:hypothetical protein
VRDARHKAAARNGGRIHHSSPPSETRSNVGVKGYGYRQAYSDGYGDGYRTGNENLKSMTRTRAVKGRGREKAKGVSKSKPLLVLTSTGRSEDRGRTVERRPKPQLEPEGSENPQHYLPYDFQLPHYSPFDFDSSSESSSSLIVDDDIPLEPGEYERDIESKRYNEYEPQKEPRHPQYQFGDEYQQVPRQPQPQPPTQNEPPEQLEEVETAFCRLSSPFSPEFQSTAPPPSLPPAELDDSGNRSRSTSSSYSGDSSQRPSSECKWSHFTAL